MKFYKQLQDILAQHSDLLPLSALAVIDAKAPPDPRRGACYQGS